MRARRTTAAAAAMLALGVGAAAAPALAEEVTVELKPVTADGVGATPIGTVTATDTEQGLALAFDVQNLLPGPHRFNIHENPSCEPGEVEGAVRAAGAAGPTWLPEDAPESEAPTDFPLIYVQIDEDGAVPYKRSLLAPGLQAEDLRGRSLVIYGSRDNYRAAQAAGSGGGEPPPVACGVVDG